MRISKIQQTAYQRPFEPLENNSTCRYHTNMLRFTLCLLAISLGGCHSIKTELGISTQVSDKSELANLQGVWYATSATYNMIKNKKYVVDTMQLALYPNATFKATNFPDCITTSAGDPVNQVLANGSGTWEIYKFGDFWKLRLDFQKDSVFKDKAFCDFDIYYNKSTLKISEFIGDPDSADILEFEKSK